MVYLPGAVLCYCDICGLRYYRHECVKDYKNRIVCDKCYDGGRDPLEYATGVRSDRQYVLDARPGQALYPTVIKTDSATSITSATAVSGGNVTNSGGSTVTAYGVCWSTSTAPDISDSKTTDGSSTGSFTSNLTSLTANTRYYVRAYATNGQGTSYGPTMSFTTIS